MLTDDQRTAIHGFIEHVVAVAEDPNGGNLGPVEVMQLKDFLKIMVPLYEVNVMTHRYDNIYGKSADNNDDGS